MSINDALIRLSNLCETHEDYQALKAVSDFIFDHAEAAEDEKQEED